MANILQSGGLFQSFGVLVESFRTIWVSGPEQRVGLRIEENRTRSVIADIEDLKSFTSRFVADLQDDWEPTADFETGSFSASDIVMDETRLDCVVPYFETQFEWELPETRK
jgi:hypothetical protein